MINVDSKVLVNSNAVPGVKLVYGTVKEIYPNDILIVELEDKTLIKCRKSDVTPVSADKDILKDKITINQVDFDSAVEEAIRPDNYAELGFLESGIVSLSGSLVASRIKRALFRNYD